ncbi:FIST signal transduction protein [Thiothrix lacustris]|uniref:FIST signal transduction protein n=1 Tax=Thiothrix lacustris TaxID=525917 RepID=UPI0027E516A1|nr:FIST C-terminal domain-containing protein [Thiothrix lacustris]WMP16027.1 FIST C-terminal domain-containing protein [Thiothrix lacustris]
MTNEHTFPLILVDTEGSDEKLFEHIERAILAGAKSLLILACDANAFTSDQLNARLQRIPIPVFGGIFPEIVAGRSKLVRGSIVCGLDVVASVYHIENLSDPNEDYLVHAEQLVAATVPGATLVTLVDGLSQCISTFLEHLYEALGARNQYIGGGAGSLSLVQKPCLFSNQGLRQDCAQIAVIDWPISIGIEHGWKKFAGPFFVTGAHDNTITSLDYRPAFEVYREEIEADSHRRFRRTNFHELAKAYPFGLERLKGSVVVRDPLRHEGNNLVCIGEVPANHIIYLLKGDAESLLAASSQCALYACVQVRPKVALLFDCISRVLFLQDRFTEEIDNILDVLPDNVPLIGVLSLGEIADAGHTCLEFFNKTTVLGVLGAGEGECA